MCIVYWPVDYATSTNTMEVDVGSVCSSRRTGRTICCTLSDILPVRLEVLTGVSVKIVFFRMGRSDV
jgi:hypothetical protein